MGRTQSFETNTTAGDNSLKSDTETFRMFTVHHYSHFSFSQSSNVLLTT